MKRPALTILMALAIIAVVFACVTFLALEYSEEVVVLRTFDGNRRPNETRTWIAEENGSYYVEAANPERPFLVNLRSQPEIEVVRGNGTVEHCRATVQPNPEGHRHIRSALRRRYGWADWWIGLIADTSGSIEVKLEPQPVT